MNSNESGQAPIAAQLVPVGMVLIPVAELEALRADKARLDSGRILTWDVDMFGKSHTVERTNMHLRAAIDAARDLDANDQRQRAAG